MSEMFPQKNPDAFPGFFATAHRKKVRMPYAEYRDLWTANR